MSKTVLLVTPPYHCGVVEVAGRWMPLGLLYLAGAARKAGWTPIVYDAMTKRHDHDEIQQRIKSLQPDIIATTAITSTYPDAVEILRRAKADRPEVITIMGGVHPTFMAEEINDKDKGLVDYVVRGEGEETFTQLLQAIADSREPHDVKGLSFMRDGQLVETPDRGFGADLDEPVAEWDAIDWEDYTYFVVPKSRLAVVSTARGCSFSCTFCSQQKFYKQSWRGRDPIKSAEEILWLYENRGANVILIADEYPTGDQSRWLTFLQRLIDGKFGGYLLMETRAEDIVRDANYLSLYKKAGITHVYVGLEATEQATLDSINKELTLDVSIESMRLLRQYGFLSETSFVYGFPNDDKASFEKTLVAAKTYNPDFAHFLAITPWPYADFYQEVKDHIAVTDYRKYNLIDPIIKPIGMTLGEVDMAIIHGYRKFYMSLSKLKEIENDTDMFRRDYMIRSMRLIMRSSFLKEKIGSLGSIPMNIEQMMERLSNLGGGGGHPKAG